MLRHFTNWALTSVLVAAGCHAVAEDNDVRRESPLTFLRSLPDDHYVEVRAERDQERREVLNSHSEEAGPPPWSIESLDIPTEYKKRTIINLGEDEGIGRLLGEIPLPAEFDRPEMAINSLSSTLFVYDDRRLAIFDLPHLDRALPRVTPWDGYENQGDLEHPFMITVDNPERDKLVVDPQVNGRVVHLAVGNQLREFNFFDLELVRSKDFDEPIAFISFAEEAKSFVLTFKSGRVIWLSPDWEKKVELMEEGFEFDSAPHLNTSGNYLAMSPKPRGGMIFRLDDEGDRVDQAGFSSAELPSATPAIVSAGSGHAHWLFGNVFISFDYRQFDEKRRGFIRKTIHKPVVHAYAASPQSDYSMRAIVFTKSPEDTDSIISEVTDISPNSAAGTDYRPFAQNAPGYREEDTVISVGSFGSTYAVVDDDRVIRVYERYFSDHSNGSKLRGLAANLLEADEFELLSGIGKVIQSLPKRQAGVSREILLDHLVHGASHSLWRATVFGSHRHKFEPLMKSVLEWHQRDPTTFSTALVSRIRWRLAQQAHSELMRGGAGGEDARKRMREHLDELEALHDGLDFQNDELPMCLFDDHYCLWLLRRGAVEDIESVTQAYLKLHSDLPNGLYRLMIGYQPQWGGEVGEVGELITSLADVIGGDEGKYCYVWWTWKLMEFSGVRVVEDLGSDRERFLSNIVDIVDRNWFDPVDTEKLISRIYFFVDPEYEVEVSPDMIELAEKAITALIDNHRRRFPIWTMEIYRSPYSGAILQRMPG